MILAIQTGLLNARGEEYNRIVKHVGCIAFGFKTPGINAAGYGGPAPAIYGGRHRKPVGPAKSGEPQFHIKPQVWS